MVGLRTYNKICLYLHIFYFICNGIAAPRWVFWFLSWLTLTLNTIMAYSGHLRLSMMTSIADFLLALHSCLINKLWATTTHMPPNPEPNNIMAYSSHLWLSMLTSITDFLLVLHSIADSLLVLHSCLNLTSYGQPLPTRLLTLNPIMAYSGHLWLSMLTSIADFLVPRVLNLTSHGRPLSTHLFDPTYVTQTTGPS